MTYLSSAETDTEGFSLVEMLVSMVVASILILTIGILSSIASRSFTRLNREQQIYNDISYGFKFMQNRVRASQDMRITSEGGVWQGKQIQINNNEMFGVCQSGSATNLVRRPTAAASCADSEVLFSASGGDPFNFILSWPCDCTNDLLHECVDDCREQCSELAVNCDCRDKVTQVPVGGSGVCSDTPDWINAQVSGTKNNIRFDVQTAIFRRNP